MPSVPLRLLVLLRAAALVTFWDLAHAAEIGETPAAAAPGAEFRILEQRKIDLGSRSIIYNRVAPPESPTVTQAPEPLAEEPGAGAAESAPAKQRELILLSATVYDRQFTELRWSVAGKEYRAWSNIDFNLFSGLGEFETADTVYLLVMGLGNETAQSAAEWDRYVVERGLPERFKKRLPRAGLFPAGRSSYLVAEEQPAPRGEADPYAALDALHLYYDANRQKLEAEALQREEEQARRERQWRENPPIPADTIINFWPKKSSVYGAAGKDGDQP